MSALEAMPEAFAAGTTVDYTRILSDYPASTGWALALHLVGPAARLSVNASAVVDSFRVTIAASATDDLPAGTYRWVHRLTKSGVVVDVEGGLVRVTPDLAVAVAGATETWEAKMLAAIEAVLQGRATSDQEAIQIAGRALTRIPFRDLMAERRRLQAVVAQQRAGGSLSRVHRIAFQPPRT